jgi:glycosyltransferase involved in cell wall biosynthesis
MKLFIIRDGAFTTIDDKPASNLLHYDIFGKRYLDVFEKIAIVGRKFPKNDPSAKPVEGINVEFIALPGKTGIKGALSLFTSVLKLAFSTVKPGNAYLLRIPGTIPSIFFLVLLLKKIPFAVEVCSDPYDAYSKKSLDGHRLSWLIQKFFVGLVKWQCKKAVSSVYVTDFSLQKRYPPGNPETSHSFTSIDLEIFNDYPRDVNSFNLETPKLVLTGNMQGSMKGHDTLIEALKILHDKGLRAYLDIIGFGKNQQKFERMCTDFGLKDYVHFLGKYPSGLPVLNKISEADLFVLPSRQEGLPRALLEAMSQAMPAVATDVGGTAELLDEEAIVPPDTPELLAEKIGFFLSDASLLAKYSKQNLNKSKEYGSEQIRLKRNWFLSELKELSFQAK